MAYFAQAGSSRPNMQGGDRERDTASGVSDGPQYTGPGAEPNYGYDGGYQGSYGYQPEGQPGDSYYADDSYGDGYDGYEGYEGGYPPPPGFRARAARLLSLFGAAASIALVAGVGVWGYKLVMRDVSGVPVVRAVEGPMRVQPDNPGGAQADHQGLAVNAVAAQGTAAAPAERLTLAPPAIRLTEDDKPLPELAAEAAPKPVPQAEAAEVAEAEDSAAEDGEQVIAAYQDGGIDALVAELTREAEPLSVQNAAADAGDLGRLEQTAAPSPALLKAPGLKQSLRPAARPARLDTSPSAPTAITPVSAPPAKEVDAESLAPGTRLVQLGAYESAEVARAEWDRISARFPGYLDERPRVIQRASSGGRTFYRLRVMGFDGLSDARRFCSALVAGNADCIPVTTR